MNKYLHSLAWMVLALLIGAAVGARADDATDQGPSLSDTKDWLNEHGKEFTSSFSFSNDSQKRFIVTIQKIEFVLKKYRPKSTFYPGCTIHFYANILVKDFDSNNDGGEIATFRAEDVSDVVQVRKLASTDLGPAVQDFDAQGCYAVVITQKDPNSDAIEMGNLGVPFLEWHELHYIVIPITDFALAQRLAKALHRGIHLIQAETPAKPEAF
ncbi:MAG TPA: hypothetical protein VNU49_02575 [Opitutaceae bacterium]|jgi:hypothetical protein|nr:hypothetical protein [Opitutaceae bacterium]